VASQAAFGDEAPELLLPRAEIVDLRYDIRCHEADIVTVERILRAGITETDPNLHARSLAWAFGKKKPPILADERLLSNR
jgi:hypothetical protein